MKTRHSLLLVLCLAAAAAQAQMNIKISTGRTFRQDTIDRKVLTVQYDMEALTDLAHPGTPLKETMRLDIGQRSSRFYSYTAYLADSVLAADAANGASMELMARHAEQYRSQWSEQTFKRYPAGRVTTLDELAGDISRLRCEEPEDGRHADPAGLSLHPRHGQLQRAAVVGLVCAGHCRQRRTLETLRPAGPDTAGRGR